MTAPDMLCGYPVHPAANIFPMLGLLEIKRLADDIRDNGQREPVALLDGKVLDGRNRLQACYLAVVDPVTVDLPADTDPIAYVVSLNLHRRHLDESQRSMVADRVADMRQGERTDLSSIERTSQAEAAELLNVSVASVKRARVVQRQGVPELGAMVDAGKLAVSTAAEVATEQPERQREIVAKGEREILAAAKEIRARKADERKADRREAVKAAEWPSDKYRVIYADPPWSYSNSGLDHSAAQQYETMAIEEIAALPVRDIATDNAILFMWTTSPLLDQAFKVISGWGFTYKSSFVWDKERPVFGHYNQMQHEFLLVATKGEMQPDTDERYPSVIRLERFDRHSAKPEEFRSMIDRLYPHGPRIELFARIAQEGWATWGNEVIGQ